ncbi:putative transcription factor AS2-LOB family [Medicago truncatula]|uniref:Lateral organ boundaries (LOB) domain protein n=1 Tax=Medicago truncatula TaxID=3880 RepID=A0A072U820_MEDTR|nr:LOB domain-containing protein 24 [Medicago truncatula]KEH21995.1 lateral organ boundaries (LOB) domain protein [Medicago truncatula]RHN44962.1 putative transcription factor AS2-LOB family [Medicago truncatula]
MIYSRCAACKSQRRRCPPDCIFSPYFPPNDPQRFSSVHRIYGGSNVGKMLQQLPHYVRHQAANSMYLEAQCRVQDPVYGCVGIISKLSQQIQDTEVELAKIKTQIAYHKLHNQQFDS